MPVKRQVCALTLLTGAVAFLVIRHGGIEQQDFSVALSLVGVAAFLYSMPLPRARGEAGWTSAIAILLAGYVAFQLIPFPLPLLRVLSPARAELADAVDEFLPGVAGPLTILPTATWLYLSKAVGYVLIFLVVQNLVWRGKDRVWTVVWPLIGIAGAEMALGFATRARATDPMAGTYYNKNHFVGLMELALPLIIMCATALIHGSHSRHARGPAPVIMAGGLFGLAAVIFASVVFASSKLGLISVMCSSAVMVFLTSEIIVPRRMRSALALVIAILAVLVVLFVASPELITGFGEVARDPTGEGRWTIATDTFHLIRSFLIFGTGFGTFYPALLRYQTTGLQHAWINAHNDYLQFMSELGVLGFAILAALVTISFVRAIRTARCAEAGGDLRFVGIGCVSSIVALLIHSMGDFNLYIPANAAVFFWVVGIACGLSIGPIGSSEEHPRRSLVGLRRLAVGSLASFAVLYASASVLFSYSFGNDPAAEQLFCHIGVCDSTLQREGLAQRYGGDAASIPPAEMAILLTQDPAGPYNWEDLGDSFYKVGRVDEAARSYARALSLGPNIPFIQIRAARFNLKINKKPQALRLMSRALDGDAGFDQTVFNDYESFKVPVSQVLRDGLPDDPAVWRSYFRRQAGGNSRAAEVVWESLVHRGFADDEVATEYAYQLIGKGQFRAAQAAWAAYATRQGCRADEYPKRNGVFNGGFETDLIANPFNWQLSRSRGFRGQIDAQVAFSGHRSATIIFDGTENVTTPLISESIYLPKGRYAFVARMKSDSISTNEGPFFEITGKGVKVMADPVIGSTDWHPVAAAIDVPDDAGLLDLRLTRRESLRFDNKIKGTVWIDDVRILPELHGTAQVTALHSAGFSGDNTLGEMNLPCD